MSLQLIGCSDWQVQAAQPAQFIQQSQPQEVRLGRQDGSTVKLRDPTVTAAAIVGMHGSDTLHLSVSDVTTVAVKRTDWVETAILVATPPALLFGLACLFGCGY